VIPLKISETKPIVDAVGPSEVPKPSVIESVLLQDKSIKPESLLMPLVSVQEVMVAKEDLIMPLGDISNKELLLVLIIIHQNLNIVLISEFNHVVYHKNLAKDIS